MAGQLASVQCTIGDNVVYVRSEVSERKVTIRLSSLDFTATEVKVFHVRQNRTKVDSDLLASYSDISDTTVEIKDVWLQNRDKIVVNSSTSTLVVNINEHKVTE